MELHRPVLVEQALAAMQPKPGERYLDLTAGYGGHAAKFLELTKNYKAAVLVDRDKFAISHLRTLVEKGAEVINSDFYSASLKLVECEKTFDLILLDLGVSSPQLDMAERGFSFMNDGPLDMRMDQGQDLTAHHVVNKWRTGELQQVFQEYGEYSSKESQRLARAIIIARAKQPIVSTSQLADLISSVFGRGWSKKHPATRAFQAIRIAVNDELGQIARTLPLLPKLLATGGRVGIISFHSLEDRLVKNYFKSESEKGLEAELKTLTKKPIVELDNVINPRARSAKLRVALKT